MTEPTLSAPNEAQNAHDIVVQQIIADIEATVANALGSYWSPMARAVSELRSRSMAADAPQLRPSQKAELLAAISASYGALFPLMAHQGERQEFHYAMNSLAHLVFVWSGELPRGGVVFDAGEFVRAFELNLRSMEIIDGIASRAAAMTQKRTEFITSVLAPSDCDSGTVH